MGVKQPMCQPLIVRALGLIDCIRLQRWWGFLHSSLPSNCREWDTMAPSKRMQKKATKFETESLRHHEVLVDQPWWPFLIQENTQTINVVYHLRQKKSSRDFVYGWNRWIFFPVSFFFIWRGLLLNKGAKKTNIESTWATKKNLTWHSIILVGW